jgi:Cu+-exporting ATPase
LPQYDRVRTQGGHVGVKSANLNFAAETATVEFDPEAIDISASAKPVKGAGYELVVSAGTENAEDAAQAARSRELKAQKRFFLVGPIFTLPLFVLSMGRDFFSLGLGPMKPG